MTEKDCEDFNLKVADIFKEFAQDDTLGYTLQIKLSDCTALMGYNTTVADFASVMEKLLSTILKIAGLEDTTAMLEIMIPHVFGKYQAEHNASKVTH